MTNTNDSPLRPDDLRFLVEEARAGRVEVLRGREHITAFVRAAAAASEQEAAIRLLVDALRTWMSTPPPVPRAPYHDELMTIRRQTVAAISAARLAGLTEKE